MAVTWDTPGLQWDRADLAWDLDATYFVIPYLFGPASVAETPWLDANFAAIKTVLDAIQPPPLILPYTFAMAGLQTPTAHLDANFAAVADWVHLHVGSPPTLTLPYYPFRSAGQNTPLHRLDADFAAIADWYNAHY